MLRSLARCAILVVSFEEFSGLCKDGLSGLSLIGSMDNEKMGSWPCDITSVLLGLGSWQNNTDAQ